MDNFSAKEFFDLETFAHRPIFSDGPVWEALKNISPYLNSLKLGVIEGEVAKGAILVNPESITIGKGSVVEPGAYIKGPCVIGQNSEIRHGAYIRGQAIIGNRCVVGHATEVKNAIFLDGAHAGHFSYIGDSILGNKVNLGAGAKLANLRFDGKPIVICYEKRKIETLLRKFGAILGDHVQLGCNSVTNPGTLMGKGSFCLPCMTVNGVVEPLSTVKSHV